jgi:sucrose synthase
MKTKTVFDLIEESKTDFFNFLNFKISSPMKLNVKGGIIDLYNKYQKEVSTNNQEVIGRILTYVTESLTQGYLVYMEIRENIGKSDYYLFDVENHFYTKTSALEYLKVKELYVKPESRNNQLTINFESFYRKFPQLSDSKNIGKGFEYLNKYLSSKMFSEPDDLRKVLFNFLFLHKYKSQQLILNERISTPEDLITNINTALKFLKSKNPEEPYIKLKNPLQEIGFEPGLGNTASRIIETLEMLEDLMNQPDHVTLQKFLARIPMIFNIVTVSSHGYFGQQGVLGKPDTGGQVVYVLDQIKALEQQLTKSLENSGLKAKPKIIILTRLIPNSEGTTCNKRIEKVYDTNNSFILRVPFRNGNKKVTDNWISRFEVWPYLETFAEDSYRELMAEFGGKPDLVIGNYSDGNLVATLLAKKYGVTQCIIAHALEKCKYLYSALYWDTMDDNYHFSVQFTADLIAMNAANFILTSSYQEIAGTETTLGQYESYLNFTLPGLYRVTGGIDLFSPKFNIVPPGVNPNIFFPYYHTKERFKAVAKELESLFFGNTNDKDTLGYLDNKNLIPIFTMGRLDKIKNITALVKWFGENKEMQKISNLIIIAGKINAENSSDIEEKEQIFLMHDLIKKFNLNGKIRWIGKILRKDQTGEAYRVIADRKGIFVQCGLFEGFGLTVIEAMRSGLPVFATLYGGPMEIIQDKVNGFLIDPINEKESQKIILSFLKKMVENKKEWEIISKNGIERVDSTYMWSIHAEKLVTLSKIYGFWKYATNLEMTELNSYLDIMYHLLYKPRAEAIRKIHDLR